MNKKHGTIKHKSQVDIMDEIDEEEDRIGYDIDLDGSEEYEEEIEKELALEAEKNMTYSEIMEDIEGIVIDNAFEMRDEGGISEEELEKIKKRFHEADISDGGLGSRELKRIMKKLEMKESDINSLLRLLLMYEQRQAELARIMVNAAEKSQAKLLKGIRAMDMESKLDWQDFERIKARASILKYAKLVKYCEDRLMEIPK